MPRSNPPSVIPSTNGAAGNGHSQLSPKDLLKELQKTHAADPQVAYWLGRTELALGNKKEAEQAYLDRAPDPLPAYPQAR